MELDRDEFGSRQLEDSLTLRRLRASKARYMKMKSQMYNPIEC